MIDGLRDDEIIIVTSSDRTFEISQFQTFYQLTKVSQVIAGGRQRHPRCDRHPLHRYADHARQGVPGDGESGPVREEEGGRLMDALHSFEVIRPKEDR